MPNPLPPGIRPAFPQHTPAGRIRARFLELLGLDRVPEAVDSTVEAVADDGVHRELCVSYVNSLGETLTGTALVPLDPSGDRIPGIVCMHGTGGTTANVLAGKLEVDPDSGQLRGWGRELANRGYATIVDLPQRVRGAPRHRRSLGRGGEAAGGVRPPPRRNRRRGSPAGGARPGFPPRGRRHPHRPDRHVPGRHGHLDGHGQRSLHPRRRRRLRRARQPVAPDPRGQHLAPQLPGLRAPPAALLRPRRHRRRVHRPPPLHGGRAPRRRGHAANRR